MKKYLTFFLFGLAVFVLSFLFGTVSQQANAGEIARDGRLIAYDNGTVRFCGGLGGEVPPAYSTH